MKTAPRYAHEALSVGTGARPVTTTAERTWPFTHNFEGRRPVGAPPD